MLDGNQPGAASKVLRSAALRRWYPAAVVAVYLLLFLALDYASVLLQGQPGIATWYPPAGLSFALALTHGAAYAPAMLLVGMLSSVVVYQTPIGPPLLGLALAHSLGYTVAGVLLRRALGGAALRSLGGVLRFVLAALLAPLPVAAAGTAIFITIGILDPASYARGLFNWWIGDAIGIVILNPLLLGNVPAWLATRARSMLRGETAAQLACLLLALWAAFFPPFGQQVRLAYPLVLPLIWVALRHGLPGATLAVFLINVGATIAIYVSSYPPAVFDELQLLMLTLSLSGLILGAAISERERANEALLASEERYRAISEMTSDYSFLYRIDEQGVPRLQWVTDVFAQITGYSPEEVEARGGWEFMIHPDDLPGMLARRAQLFAGESLTDELRIIRPWGEVRWLRRSMRPVRDASGRVRQLYGAVQDITASKQAEEMRLVIERQLHEGRRLESIGVLAGGVAHDFNNLLVGVLGNAGLALLDLPPDSPARESIQKIEIAAQRASDLTRQLLAYAGRERLFVGPVHLGLLLEEVAHMLRPALASQVTLRERIAPGLPAVEGDAPQIRQALLNILMNSAEAIGPESGAITVSASVASVERPELFGDIQGAELHVGRYVLIEVEDTGCGMDEQTRARIFDPFFSTKVAGRGLGLPAALGIVRAHRGALRVRSAPQRGTTVTIMLPAALGEGAARNGYAGHG